MALSSGGWAPVPAASPSQAANVSCNTVLMSVRVSVCHSGIRPLCLPGAGDEALRLQLSMDPTRAGEFRLALLDSSRSGRSVFIAHFDLRSVQYEVKSPRCHEMRLATPPHDCIRFNFRCDREAQEWATVVMSSLRETHRVANSSPHLLDEQQTQTQPQQQAQTQPQQHTAPGSGHGHWSAASLPLSEELCLELARAIEAGDTQAAGQHASSLAQQRAALTIQLSKKSYAEGEISLSVAVEDVSSTCSVTVKVFPYMTVAALKQQVFSQYGFHPRVQRWVIGRCLCTEPRSLASYGVQKDGDTAYLYLVSARHPRLGRQLFHEEQESAAAAPPPSNGPASQDRRGYSTLPSRLSHGSQGGGGAERPGAVEIRDALNLETLQLTDKPSKPQTGWACSSCTYINVPSHTSCEICFRDRTDTRKIIQQEKGRREDLGDVGTASS